MESASIAGRGNDHQLCSEPVNTKQLPNETVMAQSQEVLAWQDVVAAKRLRRTEAIREIAPADVTSGLLGADSAAVAGRDLVARLCRQQVSCADLVTWYLQRFVKHAMDT